MLKLLHQLDLGFAPNRAAVAADAARLAVVAPEAVDRRTLLRVDREEGIVLLDVLSDFKFERVFATEDRNLVLSRRDGFEIDVVELGPSNLIRRSRYDGTESQGFQQLTGGPSEDRLTFVSAEGTGLFHFPGGQLVATIDQHISRWQSHPLRRLASFTVFEGFTQQLGFYLQGDGGRCWLTPLFETYCMIDSYAFSWDGRVVGLVVNDGDRVDTLLYGFPTFELLYKAARNWDKIVSSEPVSLESGIAFHPRRERFLTCEPRGKIVEREYPSGVEVAVIHAHDSGVLHMQTLPSLDALVSVGNEGIVKLWSFSDGDLPYSPPLKCDPAILDEFLELTQQIEEATLRRFETRHDIAPNTSLRRAD
ncbi:MAG TPA: WD40 repeat domain-containing protein [Pirellulales bacterium]